MFPGDRKNIVTSSLTSAADGVSVFTSVYRSSAHIIRPMKMFLLQFAQISFAVHPALSRHSTDKIKLSNIIFTCWKTQITPTNIPKNTPLCSFLHFIDTLKHHLMLTALSFFLNNYLKFTSHVGIMMPFGRRTERNFSVKLFLSEADGYNNNLTF